MGREVRRVPKDWEHPMRYEIDRHIPLLGGPYSERVQEWDRENEKWKRGFVRDWSKDGLAWKQREEHHGEGAYEAYAGPRPCKDEYMPEWPEEEKTHFQMYETCSEGTPISPVFSNIEELARWLADNKASAFGALTATYEQWLAMCQVGDAPSAMVIEGHGMISGVEAVGTREK